MMMLPAVAPVTASPGVAAVPMDDLSGVLVVPVTIDGKGPYHFVLDTGAGVTVVTPQLAAQLQLQPKGSDTATGMGQQQVAIRTLQLDRIAVGGAEQQHVLAAIIPLPLSLTYQGRYGTIDGIVGATFLRNYAVSLDVANHRATLTPPALFKAPGGITPIPVTFAEQAIPVIQASADGVAGRFEVDSGNNGDVTLASPFGAAHGFAEKYGSGKTAQSEGVGGRVSETRVRLGTLSVGGSTMHGVAANIAQTDGGVLKKDDLDGNLGYDVLRRFAVTLDYAGAKLYLKPSAAFDAYKPLVGTGILNDRNADGTFRVVGTVPGSPAQLAGIKAGDAIVAVNGQPTAQMSLADYAAAVAAKAGSKVTYTLSSSAGRRDVTLTTIDMLPAHG